MTSVDTEASPPFTESEGFRDEHKSNNEEHVALEETAKADGSDSSDDATKKTWSDALRSPIDDPSFSPSLERDNSHHGWALVATLDRARALNRTSSRVVALLSQATQTYDQFATALLKAGQSLNSLIPTTGAEAHSLQEAMVFWSGETSRLSRSIKTETVLPLQQFLQVHLDSVQGIHEKYANSRHNSHTIRKRAIRARKKYVDALQDAEQAVQDWKRQQSSSSDGIPASVQTKVTVVQRKVAHYKGLVDWENQCVDQCNLLEVMALETLQKLEEDRVCQFTSSIVNVLAAEKLALQEVLVSAKQQKTSNPDLSEVTDGKKIFSKFRPGLSGAISYERGTGIMDAETLGLPVEIGELRETIRARIATRSTQAKTFRVLAGFLDYVAAAMERFSTSMEQILKKEESEDKGMEHVHDEMKDHERCSQLHILLGGLIRSLGVELDEVGACAKKLRICRSEHMDKIVFYGSKLLKPASDSEELVWKQLCEAARAQAKAEDSYRQTTAHQQKARVRATSVDSKSGKAVDGASPTRVSKHMSKSLANMFSVLPNGGENAMKILAPGTVASIVQHNLDDADERELKGRMALDSAVGTTARFIEKYKKNASSWMKQFDSEDQDGWGDLTPVFEAFSESMLSSRVVILKGLVEMDEVAAKNIQMSCEAAVTQWTCELKQQMTSGSTAKKYDASSGGLCLEGYRLCFSLEQSSIVDQLQLKAQRDQTNRSAEEEIESDEGEGETSVGGGNTPSNSSVPMEGEESQKTVMAGGDSSVGQENQVPNWLRLPTIPANGMSDSFREKLSLRSPVTRTLRRHLEVDIQTQIFATYFESGQTAPTLREHTMKSFPCCYQRGREGLTSFYGRIFLSTTNLVLASWTGDNLALRLSEGLRLEPVAEDAIQIAFTEQDEDVVVSVSGMQDCNKVLEVATQLQKEAEAMLQLKKEKCAQKALEKSKNGIHVPVPPDATLAKMEVVIRRHLRNISIQRFFEIAWSGSGSEASGESVYQRWLEEDALEVDIGRWEKEQCTGVWDNENYQQKRLVNFKIQRKTHLYIGPPIASVQQIHCCRVEGEDKCVMAMTGECVGIPYGDTFSVEVRWVATRDGANDIMVQVGVFVDFKKHSLFKNKIRSGTLDETTPVVESLFERIKNTCLEEGGEEVPEVEEELRDGTKATQEKQPVRGPAPYDQTVFACLLLMFVTSMGYFFLRGFTKPETLMEEATHDSSDLAFVNKRIDKLEVDIRAVQDTLNELVALLKKQQELQ